jgi:hypothetical protein
MLKNASEITLGTNIIFSLKILNFVQSFVKCKVSVADGTFPTPLRKKIARLLGRVR